MSKRVTIGSQITGWLDGRTVEPGDVTFRLVKVLNAQEVDASRGKWKKHKDTLSNSVTGMLPKIDLAFLDAVLGDTDMTCDLRVDKEYKGKNYVGGVIYTLFRNEISVTAKRKNGGGHDPIPHLPIGYQVSGGNRLAVTTDGDGKATCALALPGDITFTWDEYRFVKWLDAPGGKGKARIAEVIPKATFLWPDPTTADPDYTHTTFRQYVNLEAAHPDDALPEARRPAADALPARRFGKVMKIRVGARRGAAGMPIYAKVKVEGPDTKNADGGALEISFNGTAVAVGAACAPQTKDLANDPAYADFDLDFKGIGGIRATVSIGMDDTCCDATFVVESWRKVNVVFYYPYADYWPGNTFPAGILQKVKDAFAEVFLELNVRGHANLFTTFAGLANETNLWLVHTAKERATAAGLGTGNRVGPRAITWYRMENAGQPHPAFTVRANADNAATWRDARNTLHVICGDRIFKRGTQSLSVPLDKQSSANRRKRQELTDEKKSNASRIEDMRAGPKKDKLVARQAEVEQELAALDATMESADTGWISPSSGSYVTPVDIDSSNAGGSVILEWSDGEPSYWTTEDEAHWGPIDDTFLRFDVPNNKFKIVLPANGPDSPGKLAKRVKVQVYLKFRTITLGVAGGAERVPVTSVTWPPGADDSRAAYTIVHEIAHVLGFAHKKTPDYYNVDNEGDHCAHGTGITGGVNKEKIEKLLEKDKKFATCVMFGKLGSKTTPLQLSLANRFCAKCAGLVRVTDVSAQLGTREWPV